MLRRWAIVAGLALLGTICHAQSLTSVTGTITDPAGVPYSFAKVSAQLIPTTASPTVLVNGNPTQIGGQQNATTDANGTFSMNLFCNSAGGGCSVISPAATQWQFTVQSNGAPPPLGTGPQSCVALITVTGASQSVSANFSCPALGRASASSTRTIDVAAQTGANFDTQQINTATITNTSTTITAPSGTFSAGDVGKSITGFKTLGCDTGTLLQTDVPILPETTIAAFVSSSQVTTVAAATASSGAGSGCLFWGHPDDAAFAAADAAAAAATQCPTINIPAKQGWIDQPHFIVSIPACNNSSGALGGVVIGYGEVIRGQGKGSSILFIAPNLKNNAASCTGGSSTTACYFGQPGQNLRDFQMTGGDQAATAFGSLHNLFEFNNYTVLSNVMFNQYGSNDGQLNILAGSIVLWDADFSGMPSVNFNFVSFANASFIYSSAFQSNCQTGGQEVSIAAGTRIVSVGTTYTPDPCVNGLSHTEVRNSGAYYSYGDFFFNETTSNFAQAAFTNSISAAQAWFYGTRFEMNQSANTLSEPINNAVAGAFVYLSSTALGCGSAASIANNVGTMVDGGGNNVIAGTCQANPLTNPAAGVLMMSGNLSPIGTISSSTQLVASRNTLLGTTTLLPANNLWRGSTNEFELRLYAYDSAAGVGCTGNSTVTWTISYTDATGNAQTQTATETITTNGGATGGDKLAATFALLTQSGTAITYSATAPTGGACATTVPSFAAQLSLN